MSIPPPPPDDPHVPAPDTSAPEPAADPDVQTPAPERSAGTKIALVIGVIVLAVAMAWFAIGQGDRDGDDPPSTLAGDGVALTLPAGWNGTTDMTDLPEIEGLTPPQEEVMQTWLDDVAGDDRVLLVGIDGFDSVVVFTERIGKATLGEVADTWVEAGTTEGFELTERGETVVDGERAATIASVNRSTGEETYDVVWLEDGTLWVATWSTEIDRIAEIREEIDATMASLTTS